MGNIISRQRCSRLVERVPGLQSLIAPHTLLYCTVSEQADRIIMFVYKVHEVIFKPFKQFIKSNNGYFS